MADTKGNRAEYGMVADGHGFEDSPDCERISGGVNSKGSRAVAIGRQANMLLWGFYGAPDRMTSSAQRAFLNAIVYMRRFDGDAPLVQKRSVGRSWLQQYLEMLAGLGAKDLADRGENSLARYLLGQFPAELTQGKVDLARLQRWYDDHVEYMVGNDSRAFVVDADLQRLQLSNRKPELLDWLLQKLDADPTDAQALQLAHKYLDADAKADGTALAKWIRSNRPFLFFSDTGGYRWFVDRNAQRRAQTR